MPLDPSTLIARTTAGDAELAAPRHGLAIAQRRLLTLLDRPLALDELAARPGLQPDRLERDLSGLSENGLIEIHRPAGSTGPMFPPRRLSPATVVIPPPPTPTVSSAVPAARPSGAPGGPPAMRRVRRGRALLVGFATLAAVGGALWLFATPAPEPQRPAAPPPAPAGKTKPGAVRSASAGSSTTASRPLDPVRARIAMSVAQQKPFAPAGSFAPAPASAPPPAAPAQTGNDAPVPQRPKEAGTKAAQPDAARVAPVDVPSMAVVVPSPSSIALPPPVAATAQGVATSPLRLAAATPTTVEARPLVACLDAVHA